MAFMAIKNLVTLNDVAFQRLDILILGALRQRLRDVKTKQARLSTSEHSSFTSIPPTPIFHFIVNKATQSCSQCRRSEIKCHIPVFPLY